jgi:hypothetical protein
MRWTQFKIGVGYSDGTDIGPTGHPMHEGWWFSVSDGEHRERGYRATAAGAWEEAARIMLGRVAHE